MRLQYRHGHFTHHRHITGTKLKSLPREHHRTFYKLTAASCLHLVEPIHISVPLTLLRLRHRHDLAWWKPICQPLQETSRLVGMLGDWDHYVWEKPIWEGFDYF